MLPSPQTGCARQRWITISHRATCPLCPDRNGHRTGRPIADPLPGPLSGASGRSEEFLDPFAADERENPGSPERSVSHRQAVRKSPVGASSLLVRNETNTGARVSPSSRIATGMRECLLRHRKGPQQAPSDRQQRLTIIDVVPDQRTFWLPPSTTSTPLLSNPEAPRPASPSRPSSPAKEGRRARSSAPGSAVGASQSARRC